MARRADPGMTEMAPSRREIRDFIGRLLGYYQADAARHSHSMLHRREAQMITAAEILRYINGDGRTSSELMGFVPLTLDDLPERLGGEG